MSSIVLPKRKVSQMDGSAESYPFRKPKLGGGVGDWFKNMVRPVNELKPQISKVIVKPHISNDNWKEEWKKYQRTGTGISWNWKNGLLGNLMGGSVGLPPSGNNATFGTGYWSNGKWKNTGDMTYDVDGGQRILKPRVRVGAKNRSHRRVLNEFASTFGGLKKSDAKKKLLSLLK